MNGRRVRVKPGGTEPGLQAVWSAFPSDEWDALTPRARLTAGAPGGTPLEGVWARLER